MEQRVHVFDVHRFCYSGEPTKAKQMSAEGNLQIFRWIIQVQATLKMTMNHVVYFLPLKGWLEKVDKAFHDRLKIMYDFFGHAMFENMVAVTTNYTWVQESDDWHKTNLFFVIVTSPVPDFKALCNTSRIKLLQKIEQQCLFSHVII